MMTRLSRLPTRYRKQAGTSQSSLEIAFLLAWRAFVQTQNIASLSDPVPQYKPIAGRKWALDFAFPDHNPPVGIEIQGAGGGGYGRVIRCHACGVTIRARNRDGSLGKVLYVPYPSHASGDQLARDATKHNALVAAGWRLLIFTPKMMDDPEQVIGTVIRLLEQIT